MGLYRYGNGVIQTRHCAKKASKPPCSPTPGNVQFYIVTTWETPGKPLVLMTRHFDYCPSASEGDNQSVRLSAPVVSRCFPGGYNVKLYISRGRLAWWLLAFCAVRLPAQVHEGALYTSYYSSLFSLSLGGGDVGVGGGGCQQRIEFTSCLV